MPPRLREADHAPAHRAEHLPPVRARRIDRTAARAFVGLPELLAAAEAAGRFVDRAEAPALHAEPAEILDRIAEMRSFPVEDRGHAALVGEIVAGAVVAVHQHRLGGGRGFAPVEPAERQFEHRLRLVERVDGRAQAGDLVGRLTAGERRHSRDVDRVNARRDLPELGGDPCPCVGIGRIAQQLARDRGAADAAHHEGFAQPVFGGEFEQDLRCAHAAREGRAQDTELRRAIERRAAGLLAAGHRRRVAAQDQLVTCAGCDGVEAPGLARGAARFAAKIFNARRRAQMAAARGSKSSGNDLAHSPDCGIGFAAW